MGLGIEKIGAKKAGSSYSTNVFATHKKQEEQADNKKVNPQVAFLPNIGNLLNGSQNGVSTSAVRA